MHTKRLPLSINYRPVDLIFFFCIAIIKLQFSGHSTKDFAIESGISISRFQNSCIVKLSAKIRLIKKIAFSEIRPLYHLPLCPFYLQCC